jgi:hypothetical protein
MCAMNYHFIIKLLIFTRKSSHASFEKKKKGKTILVAIFCFAKNQNFSLILVKFV